MTQQLLRHGLIARADNTGLGNQTYEYYLAMNPTKVLLVDIGMFNGNVSDYSRYPGAIVIQGMPTDDDIRAFLEGLDVVFTAEAPYNPNLYDIARQMGVKTANQYNYEFTTWLKNPEESIPDLLIAPSTWNFDLMQQMAERRGVKHVMLRCPVNRTRIPYIERESFKRFLHPAGKSAAYDRNGTEIVIRASKYLETDAKIVIKFQGEQGIGHQKTMTVEEYRQLVIDEGDPNKIEFICEETPNYEDVYKLGDVIILPRRYGGNCLPMGEGMASGMPVIMPNISPNQHLPNMWLVPAEFEGQVESRMMLDSFAVDPEVLAKKIDEFYRMDSNDVTLNTNLADHWARLNSWDNMKDQYLEALCNLL
jgi:glycosyltransferase involved in cell wall biosynthesis